MAGKRRRRSWGTIKKLPSGRYRPEYTGPDGIVYCSSEHGKPATYSARIDAEHWLTDVRRSIDLEKWRPPGAEKVRGLTLREYSKTWLADRTLTPRTRALYEDLLRLHVNPVLGDQLLVQISPAAVRAWHSGLQTGSTRKAHAYSLLHAIMATAVADEVINANPCRIRAAMTTKRKRDITLLTADELHVLADEMPEALRAAVLLLGWCGLRSGEMKELRRKDMAADGSVIRVERAVTYRSGVTAVGSTKGKAGRTVTVPPHIRAEVLEHLERHVSPSRDALLFTGTGERGHITDWDFRKPFKKAAKEIGKPELRIHDLRHVGAVLAAQAGATTAELMGRIGHTTPAMALRYQHVAAGRDAEIAAEMSKRRRGS